MKIALTREMCLAMAILTLSLLSWHSGLRWGNTYSGKASMLDLGRALTCPRQHTRDSRAHTRTVGKESVRNKIWKVHKQF